MMMTSIAQFIMNHSEKEKLVKLTLNPAFLHRFTSYNDDYDDDIHYTIHHEIIPTLRKNWLNQNLIQHYYTDLFHIMMMMMMMMMTSIK